MVIYMDDILITSLGESQVLPMKIYLHGLFTIKDLGPMKYFLGTEIARANNGLILSLEKYIDDFLKDAGVHNATLTSSPLPFRIKLAKK